MKKQDKIITFLGRNTRFEGRLTFQGAIRIDGAFVGEIDAPEGNLIIGEGAQVESEIHVASVIISGDVRGNIVADQKIEVLVPGKVTGNIQAPTVMVQEGVVFSGNCKTLPPENTKKGKLALVCEAQTS
jgi:cytoskeletal protein CcmA (bactofilin family)